MNSIVYFIRCIDSGLIKIGYTTDINGRKASLNHASPAGVSLIASAPGGSNAEASLHRKFEHLKVRGEWFRPRPELLDYIANVRAGGSLELDDAVSADAEFASTYRDESGEFRDRMAAAIKLRLHPFTHITQKALAQGIGVTRNSVNNWVNAKSEPTAYLVSRIDAYFYGHGYFGFLAEIYGDLAEPMSKREAAR